MKKIFSQWFCMLPFSISWHQYQINALHDFLQGVLISKTLVPATAGRKSVSGTVKPRNGAKRAFRLYNNKRITQENMAAVAIGRFLRYAGKVKKIKIIIDWTTLYETFMLCSVSMVTGKRRSIPIFYDGYEQGKLCIGRGQNTIEENLLNVLFSVIQDRKRITVIADRGFDRPDFFEFLKSSKVKFVIRLSEGTKAFDCNKIEYTIGATMAVKGGAHDFGIMSYSKKNPVDVRIVSVWDNQMKEPWLIATNIENVAISTTIWIYSLRWEIECMFKSKKNVQSGMNWKQARLHTIERWLRLAFFATLLFQFLGEIGILCDSDRSIIKRYSLCGNAKRRVFSIYSLALNVLDDVGRIYEMLFDGDDILVRPMQGVE